MRLLVGVVLLAASTTLTAAQYLDREPPMGALQEGQRVLVDDGSCGPGKVKEVIGGNHVKVGGTKRVVRTRHCIAKR
jgi:Family of unknown function (DUF6719)